jgi:hypothetical protein
VPIRFPQNPRFPVLFICQNHMAKESPVLGYSHIAPPSTQQPT